MSLRMGITVSMPWSRFSRPISGPLMKPRSTSSTFITPEPTVSRKVFRSGQSAVASDSFSRKTRTPATTNRSPAASPAAASPLGLRHLLFLFLADGMVVLVEEQPLRALVTRVVGHEQVGAVGDEQAIGVERPEFLVHGDDVAVVPLLERLRLGVAGQLAEEV